MIPVVDLKSMTPEELEAYFKELGQPGFRAMQVFRWLHRGVESFDEMSDLPRALREALKERCLLTVPRVERRQVSQVDGTIKYLWRLLDGNCIETVLMRYKHGNTVCVSSQVGCNMGCVFCASTLGGKVRDLSPAEILDQVIFTQKDSGTEISNIVLMGIGEPLDNFDNVVRFLELLSSPEGENLSLRHVSLSTCGLVDRIYDLMKLKLGLTLSISLHAPNDRIRGETMPISRRYDMDTLLKACRDYFDYTGRRISFEYALIDGLNDTPECAAELAGRLTGMPCHVNLIPVNPVKERGYRRGSRQNILRFQKLLEQKGINATIRRELGSDINAACGQLRRESQQLPNDPSQKRGELPC